MPLTVGGVPVSAATEARLRRQLAELERWNGAINLVAKSTLADAWDRHIADSAQLLLLAPETPVHWADLGSGAGFPGLVVAIILAERSPETRVTLVESDRRKATFLRESVRGLGLTTTVLAERIETITPLCADVVSARALARLEKLLPLTVRHIAPDGIALFLKGAAAQSELAMVCGAWSFSLERLPSQTDPTSEILRLKDLIHV